MRSTKMKKKMIEEIYYSIGSGEKAALLENGKVIGLVFDAPKKGRSIEIAGAFTRDSSPVNVREFEISRSKKNLARAEYTQPVSLTEHGVYTFECVKNGVVVY